MFSRVFSIKVRNSYTAEIYSYIYLRQGAIVIMNVCLSVSLFVCRSLCIYYWFDLLEKIQKMGIDPTYNQLNFDFDVDTKNNLDFSHLLIFSCLGAGRRSPSALVV